MSDFKNYLNEQSYVNEADIVATTEKNLKGYLKTLGIDLSGFDIKPTGQFGKPMNYDLKNHIKKHPLTDILFKSMSVDVRFGYDETGMGGIELHYKWETADGGTNGSRVRKQIRNGKIVS